MLSLVYLEESAFALARDAPWWRDDPGQYRSGQGPPDSPGCLWGLLPSPRRDTAPKGRPSKPRKLGSLWSKARPQRLKTSTLSHCPVPGLEAHTYNLKNALAR